MADTWQPSAAPGTEEHAGSAPKLFLSGCGAAGDGTVCTAQSTAQRSLRGTGRMAGVSCTC